MTFLLGWANVEDEILANIVYVMYFSYLLP